MKKMGRKLKLIDRGMRLLQRYILANCFEPLYVITCRSNEGTGLQLSIPTVRRYVSKMNTASHIAVTYSMGKYAQRLDTNAVVTRYVYR